MKKLILYGLVFGCVTFSFGMEKPGFSSLKRTRKLENTDVPPIAAVVPTATPVRKTSNPRVLRLSTDKGFNEKFLHEENVQPATLSQRKNGSDSKS